MIWYSRTKSSTSKTVFYSFLCRRNPIGEREASMFHALITDFQFSWVCSRSSAHFGDTKFSFPFLQKTEIFSSCHCWFGKRFFPQSRVLLNEVRLFVPSEHNVSFLSHDQIFWVQFWAMRYELNSATFRSIEAYFSEFNYQRFTLRKSLSELKTYDFLCKYISEYFSKIFQIWIIQPVFEQYQ